MIHQPSLVRRSCSSTRLLFCGFSFESLQLVGQILSLLLVFLSVLLGLTDPLLELFQLLGEAIFDLVKLCLHLLKFGIELLLLLYFFVVLSVQLLKFGLVFDLELGKLCLLFLDQGLLLADDLFLVHDRLTHLFTLLVLLVFVVVHRCLQLRLENLSV